MNKLDLFFKPNNVAIIGASRTPGKVGYIILENFVKRFPGKIFPVNPNAESIMNLKCYKNISEIKEVIDLAVITVPSDLAIDALNECVKRKVKSVVMITSGFGEIGNKELDEKMRNILSKGETRMIGPNTIGVFSSFVDTQFIPEEKMKRPRTGGISIISQSGAFGTVLMEWASFENIGINKFAGIGNALDLSESDMLEYLGNDPETKCIVMYLESVKDGKRFFEVANNVTKKKPVIIFKSGKSKSGQHAAMLHTGSLAGESQIYSGVFRQCGIIEARTVEEMFDFAKAVTYQPQSKGDRICVITNGGGFGVVAADALEYQNLKLSQLSQESLSKLKLNLSAHANVSNPLDVTGDAHDEQYSKSIEILNNESSVDAMIVIAFTQLTTIDDKFADTVIASLGKKPVLVVLPGGDYAQSVVKVFEERKIPAYYTPERAVNAMKALIDYSNYLR